MKKKVRNWYGNEEIKDKIDHLYVSERGVITRFFETESEEVENPDLEAGKQKNGGRKRKERTGKKELNTKGV